LKILASEKKNVINSGEQKKKMGFGLEKIPLGAFGWK
jgi:hypothetical protein